MIKYVKKFIEDHRKREEERAARIKRENSYSPLYRGFTFQDKEGRILVVTNHEKYLNGLRMKDLLNIVVWHRHRGQLVPNMVNSNDFNSIDLFDNYEPVSLSVKKVPHLLTKFPSGRTARQEFETIEDFLFEASTFYMFLHRNFKVDLPITMSNGDSAAFTSMTSAEFEFDFRTDQYEIARKDFPYGPI